MRLSDRDRDRLLSRASDARNPFDQGAGMQRFFIIAMSICLILGVSLLLLRSDYLPWSIADLDPHTLKMQVSDGHQRGAMPAAKRQISRAGEGHEISCQLVSTRPVETLTKNVYRWVDADGITHFADKQPADASIVKPTLDRVLQQEKKFSIAVKSRDAHIPPFLQDRIYAVSEKMYQFLSKPLEPSQIRQADIKVHLIKDEAVFLNAYGLWKPGQINPSGFYTSRTNEAFVLAKGSADSIQTTALHETAHVIMAALYQRTPTWLNEGIAEYYEVQPTSVFHSDPQPKPEWIRTLRRDGLISFQALFSIDGEQWQRMPPDKSYANAWVVVYYLMQSEAGKQALGRLLATVKANPCTEISSYEVLNRSYPGGVLRLEQQVKAWLG